MKKYVPQVLGAVFVLTIIVVWGLIAQVVKGLRSEPVSASTDIYQQLQSRYGQPYLFRDGVNGGTTTWKDSNRYIDLARDADTSFVRWRCPLWPEGLPSDNGLMGMEEDRGWGVVNVASPVLTIFPAPHPTGKAILMCPGGSYACVCDRNEGTDWVGWMHWHGITPAVLRYRMPNGHHTIPLQDAQRAMAMLHDMADELKFNELGVMGFSAGGHLASTVATHFTSATNRPDFQILVYPVISMDTTITHAGTHDNLLGEEPTDELVALYSNERQVTSSTPRAFIMLSGDDSLVPIANSLRYYQALQQADVPAVLHMYETGGHGWGFRQTSFHDAVLKQLEEWLR